MSLLNVCTSANLNFWISGNRDLPSLTGWCSVSLWLLSSASVTKFRLHMRQRWRFVLCLVWSRLSDYKYKTKYIKVNILVIWQKSAIKIQTTYIFLLHRKKNFNLCVFSWFQIDGPSGCEHPVPLCRRSSVCRSHSDAAFSCACCCDVD